MTTKQEPGTGPLTFVVQEEKPVVHACGDCRHAVDRGEAWERCGAFGMRYTLELRGQMLAKGEWFCTGFSAREAPKPTKPPVVRVRRGWLYRLLAWIWVLAVMACSDGPSPLMPKYIWEVQCPGLTEPRVGLGYQYIQHGNQLNVWVDGKLTQFPAAQCISTRLGRYAEAP